jgi:type I restriction enzyme M protein
MANHKYLENRIWAIADILRGVFPQSHYGNIMLPMIVLRRFDCVLAPTKIKVLEEYETYKDEKANDEIFNTITGQNFHNHSSFDLDVLMQNPEYIERYLINYINGFSANVYKIFNSFDFEKEIKKMSEASILSLIVSKFYEIDLHPNVISNREMVIIFENLVKRFYVDRYNFEYSTPHDVSHLMVNLLFRQDDKLLATRDTTFKLLDPVCGTGGMLNEAHNYLHNLNPDATLHVYGQEINLNVFAIALASFFIRGTNNNVENDENIFSGDIFVEDKLKDKTFDYFLAHPPFGGEWKRQQKTIKSEHENKKYEGRFGAGLPRVSDSSLLFLQHMISKFKPMRPENKENGSRLAIIFNANPLSVGGAGSGESEIRKWIIEKDWLETIIALPENVFYHTSIGTYVWIVTNRKEERRKGKVQLIDARECYFSMKRKLGSKHRSIGVRIGKNETNKMAKIVKSYDNFEDNNISKILDDEDFGYTRITVERPLRLCYQMTAENKARFLDACPHLFDDVQAIDTKLGRESYLDWNEVWSHIEKLLHNCNSSWKASEKKLFYNVFTQKEPRAEPVQKNGKNKGYESDIDLRDFETIPLKEDIDEYFKREVLPHVPDAWIDRTKDVIGYEINFDQHFYHDISLRSLKEIDADLKQAKKEIIQLLDEAINW